MAELPTLVDSNVILDVTTDDARWADWSSGQLARAADEGRLVINPIVYAEVSVRFDSIEVLDEVLPETRIRREPLPYAAGFVAGKAHLSYRRRGGRKLTPLPDFYIGAHAAVAHYRLLTRDATRYRTYFPSIELLAPDT